MSVGLVLRLLDLRLCLASDLAGFPMRAMLIRKIPASMGGEAFYKRHLKPALKFFKCGVTKYATTNTPSDEDCLCFELEDQKDKTEKIAEKLWSMFNGQYMDGSKTSCEFLNRRAFGKIYTTWTHEQAISRSECSVYHPKRCMLLIRPV